MQYNIFVELTSDEEFFIVHNRVWKLFEDAGFDVEQIYIDVLEESPSTEEQGVIGNGEQAMARAIDDGYPLFDS